MNAYFFTLSTTNAQVRPIRTGRGLIENEMQVWSGRETFTVCAESLEAAQKIHGDCLAARKQEENPMETKVHEMMAAQFVGELLTEKGSAPLDWPEIARQTLADIKSLPVVYMEQGYWIDEASINGIPGSIPNVELLRQSLPDNIRSGLNWAEDPQFYFQFTVLSQSGPPEAADEVPEAEVNADPQPGEGTPDESQVEGYLESEPYPKLTPMEATVLVRARNSAVAAWIWHRYAAATKLAGNPIQMEMWGTPAGLAPEKLPDGN